MNALRDLVHGMRGLAKAPAFTAVALLTIALGIGANTALFSVINAVLLQPLSYPEPERMVQLVFSGPEGPSTLFSELQFQHFRAQSEVFDDVAAYDFGGPGVNLTDGDRPERVNGIHVSRGYFRLFGAQLQAGRTFTEEEDRPGGGHVVVISEGLWRRKFGADPAIVSGAVSLGNESYSVVGVIASSFQPDPPADLWLPLQAPPNSQGKAHYLRVAARMKRGASLERTRAQLEIITDEFRGLYPEFNPTAMFTAWPLRDTGVRDIRTVLWILFGAVTLVLLIACANVANLLLVRGASRRREMALRLAIGASRGRLIWQSLSEGIVLSLGGGILGLLLARISVPALLALNPGSLPRLDPATILDGRVLAFTSGVSLAAGLLFGIFPAWSASRSDPNRTLNEGGARASQGAGDRRARSTFVVVQVSLAVVLLVGAGLLLQSFTALRSADSGIDPSNVLTMEMALSGTRFEQTARVAELAREAERRLVGLPGVSVASSSWMLPVENIFTSVFVVGGRDVANVENYSPANLRPVSPGFFEVFRIPLLRGRLFNNQDAPNSDAVVLISETMANKFWPEQDPIGKTLTIDPHVPEFGPLVSRRIIGVVGNVRSQIAQAAGPTMYVPQAQVSNGFTRLDVSVLPITWVVRTRTEPLALATAVEEELRKASGGLPVSRVRSMEQVLGESVAQSDFNALLLSVFAATALLLASIGIYGLLSYGVEQRTREIGIRVALGAGPRQVRSGVVMDGLKVASIGLAVGIAGALGLARLLGALLYETSSVNPLAIGAVSLLVVLVVAAASYVPVRRATRISPVEALQRQ